VAEDVAQQQLLAELAEQLQRSRQQQERLGEALTRVVGLLDEAERS
jgi:hypothetical protein